MTARSVAARTQRSLTLFESALEVAAKHPSGASMTP